jgi:hypothetical protein
MASAVRVDVDVEAAWNVALRSDGLYQMIRSEADRRAAQANAMAGDFKTGKYHRDHKSPAVGGTHARYSSKTGRPLGRVPVGMVHTGNYAAIKENMKHNTLAKVLR